MTENELKQNINLPSKKTTGFGFYATGRASRKTYWTQLISNFLLSIVIFFVYLFIVGISKSGAIAGIGLIAVLISIISLIVYNVMLTIRRIHDFGSTGWLYLIIFLPFVGWVAWIIFGCIASEPGANRFGTEPDVTK